MDVNQLRNYRFYRKYFIPAKLAKEYAMQLDQLSKDVALFNNNSKDKVIELLISSYEKELDYLPEFFRECMRVFNKIK